VLLAWPLYLLSVVYGPQVLVVFGHSYRAGYPVMVILGLTMLLATACGQVDMVLITTGRSSWSLINGLLTVGVNVGVDVALIPRYGILGAAIGWAVAIVVSNIMPLVQLAAVVKLHPFGRGTLVAAVLCALCFLAVPLGVRSVLGSTPVGMAAAIALGCVLFAPGLWVFRNTLSLSAMPGVSALKKLRR
jgi:O-antigen/teichoic acid export membrane protein